jgi:hypothetical protein
MNKSWTTLPVEVLTQIFSNPTLTSDTQQAQLACKSWTAIAQSKLYEHVKLIEVRDLVYANMIDNLSNAFKFEENSI